VPWEENPCKAYCGDRKTDIFCPMLKIGPILQGVNEIPLKPVRSFLTDK
jgi:hypothetical protein